MKIFEGDQILLTGSVYIYIYTYIYMYVCIVQSKSCKILNHA